MNNNFYSIAEEDLESSALLYKSEKYNNCVVLCEQSVEKMLKYLLEIGSVENDALFSIHNLATLYVEMRVHFPKLTLEKSDLFLLTNYYTKARYPDEGFVEVTGDLALQCL